MSPSTAPASIEVSCPGSPTSTSRASPRTASITRAISDSETIEVSSTITTSCGSLLARSWRKRLCEPGRQPSSRCSVDALSSSSAGSPSIRASACTASSSRAAALPVGAARATSGSSPACRGPARPLAGGGGGGPRGPPRAGRGARRGPPPPVGVFPPPRPPGDARDPPPHGQPGRPPLPLVTLPEQPVEPDGEQELVDG